MTLSRRRNSWFSRSSKFVLLSDLRYLKGKHITLIASSNPMSSTRIAFGATASYSSWIRRLICLDSSKVGTVNISRNS